MPAADGGTPVPIEDYAYDAEGNRTASYLSSVYTSNAFNQLTEDSTYSYAYDARGNRISRTNKGTGDVETYSYDSQNRLIGYANATVTASYAYDALDRRIAKTVDGAVTAYVYHSRALSLTGTENIWLEFEGGHLARRWAYGPELDEVLSFEAYDADSAPGAGVAYDIYSDRLGSVVSVIDASSASSVAEYIYDAFGTRQKVGGNYLQPFGFTGREHDLESGLVYFRARYFDPRSGRFIQQDPANFEAGDFNLYSYVKNDPINWVDPLGLMSSPAGGAAPVSPISAEFMGIASNTQRFATSVGTISRGVLGLVDNIVNAIQAAPLTTATGAALIVSASNGNNKKHSRAQEIYYLLDAQGRIQKIGLKGLGQKRYAASCLATQGVYLRTVQVLPGGPGARAQGLFWEQAHIDFYRATHFGKEPPRQVNFPC